MAKQTSVVNIKYDKEYDEYIGRPTIYGNQYSHLTYSTAKYKANSVEEAVELFEKDWRQRIEKDPINTIALLKELKGKKLGCFCRPVDGFKDGEKMICHGQVLIMLINEHCK